MGTFQCKGATWKHQFALSRTSSKPVSKLVRTKAFVPFMNQNGARLITPAYFVTPSVVSNQNAVGSMGGGFFSFLNRQLGIGTLINTFNKIQGVYGVFQQVRSMYNTFQSLMKPKAMEPKATGPRAATIKVRSKRKHRYAGNLPNKSRSPIRSSYSTAARK